MFDKKVTMFLRNIKIKLFSFFREFLVFHHSSLEFRAKLFAAMISAKKDIDKCEEETLNKIAYQIYKDDEVRAEIFINTVKEYIEKVREMNDLGVDELVVDIDKNLKKYPKFYKKIDIELLKKFLKCKASTDEKLLRLRIIEFLQDELKEYSLISKKNEKK
jgi:hypothetical protein